MSKRLTLTQLFFTLMVLLLTQSSLASDVMGIQFYAGMWNTQLQNSFRSIDPITSPDDETLSLTPTRLSVYDLNTTRDKQGYWGVTIHHQFTLLPRLHYRQTRLNSESNSITSEQVNFGDQSFEAQQTLTSEININHQALTLYYTIYDRWIKVDLGLTQKGIDGNITLSSSAEDSEPIDEEGEENGEVIASELASTEPIDYTYTNYFTAVEVVIPFTNLTLSHDIHYLNSGEEQLGGRETKISYQSSHIPLLTFEAGYRKEKFISPELGNIHSSLFASGSFLTIRLTL